MGPLSNGKSFAQDMDGLGIVKMNMPFNPTPLTKIQGTLKKYHQVTAEEGNCLLDPLLLFLVENPSWLLIWIDTSR